MNKSSRKRQAQLVVIEALEKLQPIVYEHQDKNILELMIAIAAIGGAFEDGWLAELMLPIEKMVAEKHPELAQQIEVSRRSRSN